jgi:hypothetical protein
MVKEIEVSGVPPSMWSLVSSHLDTDTETSAQLDPSISLSAVEGDAIATGVGQTRPFRAGVGRRLILAALVVLSLSAGFTLVYLIG